MSKRTYFLGIVGIIAFSFLFIPAANFADQYYGQYSGNSFHPRYPSSTYARAPGGLIYHNDTNDEYYFCPVNFSVPDGSTYFVKSIGMRFYDNLIDGSISIELRRKNIHTGNFHTVAIWESGVGEASSVDQSANKGTEAGFKLIDTKKFVYYLNVYFYREGDTNPGLDLSLYQVRIHYGT